MLDLTGRRLGERFDVLDRADDAGPGVAWRARDLERDGPCVVKALRPGADLRALDAYRRLQGARILSLRAAGLAGDLPWAAVDAPAAPSLARRLADARRDRRPFELAEVRALALALTSALFTAHQSHEAAATTHGGLTPWSVFVRELSRHTCELAVGDFGLLLAAPPADPELAEAGAWFPVAPEAERGARAPTPAADVYAAAVILAAMLSPDATHDARRATLLRDPGAGLDRLRPGLHPSLRDALSAALQRDPAKRPPNANRFARLLRDATWTESPLEVSAPPRREEPAPPTPAAEASPVTRARVAEAWVAPRPRAMTAPAEAGFGASTTAAPPREEDTVRSAAADEAVAPPRLPEPDTEIVSAQRFDAGSDEATVQRPPPPRDHEATAPLPRPPTSPIAPSAAAAAHEVTVGLDVQYGKFGRGATVPPQAVGDSGTVVVAPAAAAAYLHVAEQQRIAPTPDFEATAAVDAATIARASASSAGAAAERRGPSAQPPAARAAPSAWWVPAVILGAAVVLGAIVFVALTRG